MKHYIKGGNETKKGNKKQLPKPITIIINSVLPVILLLVAGFYLYRKHQCIFKIMM